MSFYFLGLTVPCTYRHSTGDSWMRNGPIYCRGGREQVVCSIEDHTTPPPPTAWTLFIQMVTCWPLGHGCWWLPSCIVVWAFISKVLAFGVLDFSVAPTLYPPFLELGVSRSTWCWDGTSSFHAHRSSFLWYEMCASEEGKWKAPVSDPIMNFSHCFWKESFVQCGSE